MSPKKRREITPNPRDSDDNSLEYGPFRDIPATLREAKQREAREEAERRQTAEREKERLERTKWSFAPGPERQSPCNVITLGFRPKDDPNSVQHEGFRQSMAHSEFS